MFQQQIDRDTDFFLQDLAQVRKQVGEDKAKNINQIKLQCLGYGVFNTFELVANFKLYLEQLVQSFSEINKIMTLKINFSGFNLGQKDSKNGQPNKKILDQIVKCVEKLKGRGLKSLSILTSNLTNVTLQDFQALLQLQLSLNNEGFEYFNLQCSNWIFQAKQNSKPLTKQPQFSSLRGVLDSFATKAKSLNNKTFRLQISGWYYEKSQALRFLGFTDKPSENPNLKPYAENVFQRDLQVFYEQVKEVLRKIIVSMSKLELFQFDMRNNHDILKLKSLKSKIDKQDMEKKTLQNKSPVIITEPPNKKGKSATVNIIV